MLSIDLGPKNLAWVYLYSRNKIGETKIEEENELEFGMINIDADKPRDVSIVVHRCQKLGEFMNSMIGRFPNIRILIVEQQTRFNNVCMNLLYSLVSFATEIKLEVFLFPPILKFTAIQQPFDTKKKAHKQLSIDNCKKFLSAYFPDKLSEFLRYIKKDDLADAMNQSVIYALLRNYLWIDMEEYKKVIFLETNRFRPINFSTKNDE
jgi:hypothetical protein